MSGWIRPAALAVLFTIVGAFATSLWLEIRREPADAADLSGVWEGRRIRVEVLNGGGVDGLAREVTNRLRDEGFDVVYYGNAREFGRDSSVAIGRIPDPEPARRVADALGLRQVLHRPDENLYLDVTLILGRDLSEPAPAANAGEPPAGWELWLGRMRRAASRLWPD